MSAPTEVATEGLRVATEGLRVATEWLRVATGGLREATESLRRAEERRNNFMDANPSDFASAGFLALSAEVTRCTAVLAGAEQTLAGAEQILAGAEQILAGAEQTLVDLSKLQIAQITAERDLLLKRSPTLATMFPLSPPSTHPSEHSLNPTERATRRQTRINEKQQQKEENAQMKADTILFYYGQSQSKTIKDMLTNYDFPIPDVHRSHIFQASWQEGKFIDLILAGGLEYQEITKDSPENMLLLHDHVESKYDTGQLLIEYDESSQNFICRILDQRIANQAIFLNPDPEADPVTFGEYDGQALHFPSASRPLKRLIRFRAIVNRLVAIDRGYIQAQDYEYLMDSDNWSPGTKALFESIIDWNSKIPTDSHLYVNTALLTND